MTTSVNRPERPAGAGTQVSARSLTPNNYGMISITETEYTDIQTLIDFARRFLLLNEGRTDATNMPHFEDLRDAVARHQHNINAVRRKPNSGLDAAMQTLLRMPQDEE